MVHPWPRRGGREACSPARFGADRCERLVLILCADCLAVSGLTGRILDYFRSNSMFSPLKRRIGMKIIFGYDCRNTARFHRKKK